MPRTFAEEWERKVELVRGSAFWRQVSSPPAGRIVADTSPTRADEVRVDERWSIAVEGGIRPDGPAAAGIGDLQSFLWARLGILLMTDGAVAGAPRILFRLSPNPRGATSRWDHAFELAVRDDLIRVTAPTEESLLRASLYLSNFWSLRRSARLKRGRRTVKPSVDLHIGADLWGGFSTTQAWVYGREEDANWIELARMGIDAVPIMTRLEDYLLADEAGPFASLGNPAARDNRTRLARLARQCAKAGVYLVLMAYNPKPRPDHAVFAAYPNCAGALQSGGAFRALCTSDPRTRRFLADAWASLFSEIPELGGILAITGGEGFYHCFMRGDEGVKSCPRCSKRRGSEVVAELVNDVARAVRAAHPEARLVTWPYSAGHWSGDRDQVAFIEALDPKHVVFQTEVDKDSVDWRPAGYAKNIWDYSISTITPSERSRRQRALCAAAGLAFSVKIEVNNSIECLSTPYFPALENQLRIWENARSLRPAAIHSRWLFDGSCKSNSEELGYWAVWGRGMEYGDLDVALRDIARRDFGPRAAPAVRRAWRLFSDALRHHPMLDYYRGPFFVGAGQPLVLDPERTDLDPVFYGRFYWHWEASAIGDDSAFEKGKPLFYDRPAFHALARRGPRKGRDVALDELRTLAVLWKRGVRALEGAARLVPAACRRRYRQELAIARHLACTWSSGANVEEFLRVRDVILDHSRQSWVRSGHLAENLADLRRLKEIARDELRIAREDLRVVRGADFLDLALRMDMGTASTEEILRAKERQVRGLLAREIPALEARLRTW